MQGSFQPRWVEPTKKTSKKSGDNNDNGALIIV